MASERVKSLWYLGLVAVNGEVIPENLFTEEDDKRFFDLHPGLGRQRISQNAFVRFTGQALQISWRKAHQDPAYRERVKKHQGYFDRRLTDG